jgi:hypothetical protein
MTGPASNLSELTVTCNQCGSASMERLGPREYRCNHCGAITVVSQDQVDRANAAAQTQVASGQALFGSAASYTTTNATRASVSATGNGRRRAFGLLTFLAILLTIYLFNRESSPSPSSSSTSTSTPTVSAKLVTLSSPEWSSDPNSNVGSGRYTALLFNHSAWPIVVPRYTMTLYLRGIKGATAYSEAPAPRLMPGEYEPISFAFEAPSDDPHTEISSPDTVDRASTDAVQLVLGDRQLVREEGKPGYRLVGVVTNSSSKPVASAEVLVMLFGANRTLIGYGRGYTRALRSGEKAAIEVPLPTSNVSSILSYEYVVDATPDNNS